MVGTKSEHSEIRTMMESGLNELVCSLVSAGSDTKKKLTIGQQIIDYLGAGNEVSGSDDVPTLIDTLVPWLNSSNFKVRQSKYLQFTL